jgi:hypothetical protein
MLKPYQLDSRILEEQKATILTEVNLVCSKKHSTDIQTKQERALITAVNIASKKEALVAVFERELDNSIGLIDQILQANRTSTTLADLCQKAGQPEYKDWELKEGLLQYKSRLVVPDDCTIQVELIKEAYNQVSTVHPGRNKTRKILVSRYYWPGLPADVAQYVHNCHECRRATVPRDRLPGLLQLLPVPECL